MDITLNLITNLKTYIKRKSGTDMPKDAEDVKQFKEELLRAYTSLKTKDNSTSLIDTSFAETAKKITNKNLSLDDILKILSIIEEPFCSQAQRALVKALIAAKRYIDAEKIARQIKKKDSLSLTYKVKAYLDLSVACRDKRQAAIFSNKALRLAKSSSDIYIRSELKKEIALAMCKQGFFYDAFKIASNIEAIGLQIISLFEIAQEESTQGYNSAATQTIDFAMAFAKRDNSQAADSEEMPYISTYSLQKEKIDELLSSIAISLIKGNLLQDAKYVITQIGNKAKKVELLCELAVEYNKNGNITDSDNSIQEAINSAQSDPDLIGLIDRAKDNLSN
ncbi:hypothetical protein A3J90_07875 [candidate division WOR-1 bacterium RIFOXYC2_FULL_37_10]|uniref:Uncharacterized protein n=1 Tax=candidate division WOR-1 bacterium RIFOXYB2_FULL_37_13 TaxID=1802579 RepID=A0A1F4SY83_UNCSA|nr:MAG: hypothetical protein A2310_01140 [candidate division WOR-1 bacterium RIFOXYB2_FULL_37_13]OGC36943.1 MAG: hypothetical protein A3J90_07875 [candidate division WOR-1 bacterium RIFOXYC2_FULL_37_10]